MDPIQRFLEENTFECPRGLGRLTPAQCEKNRSRPSARDYARGKTKKHQFVPLKPSVCESCEEWKNAIARFHEKKKSKSREEIMPEKEKKILCENCRQKPAYRRGLCRPCYRKALNLAPNLVLIDLRRYPNLREKILEESRKNFRTPKQEVLFALHKFYSLDPQEA